MERDDIHYVAELDQLSFSLPWTERSFRFEVEENDRSRCWVAEINGRIVGMLILWLIVDEAHIATLAVHPEHRRKGFASRLLKEALSSAYLEGARSSTLEVRAGNLAARDLYDQFGFVVVGRRPRYYKDNYEDAILLTLDHLEEIQRLQA